MTELAYSTSGASCPRRVAVQVTTRDGYRASSGNGPITYHYHVGNRTPQEARDIASSIAKTLAKNDKPSVDVSEGA